MGKNCLTILKNTSPELHDYLRDKAAMDYDESPASKQAYIQAARELQNETLNNLNDIYADLKIGDYKKVAAPTAHQPSGEIKNEVEREIENTKSAIEGAKMDEDFQFEGVGIKQLNEDLKILQTKPEKYFARRLDELMTDIQNVDVNSKEWRQTQDLINKYQDIWDGLTGNKEQVGDVAEMQTGKPVSSVEGGEVKVTDFEKEEMLSMIDNRIDTVSEDIESASGIEAETGALDKLKTKLESGENNFTKGELQWLKEEADDFLSKAEASFDADGNPQAKRDIPKIKKFISKIDQAIQFLPKGEAAKQPEKPKIRVSAEQVEQGQPKKSEPVKKLSASLSERLSSIKPKVQKRAAPKEKVTEDINKGIGSEDYKAGKGQLTGRTVNKTIANGEKISGTYKVVSADDVVASHNEESFAKSANFPVNKDGKTVNDRDYQTDANAQSEVIKIAQNLDDRAIHQTPVVSKDGIVLDGNNRTMSRKLAAKRGTDKAYMDALKDQAELYGIDPAGIGNIKNPILVFESQQDFPYTTETFKKFNVQEKKEKSPVEKAVEVSKTITDRSRRLLFDIYGDAETASDVTSTPSKIKELINLFQSEGLLQSNEIPRYFNAEKLTATKEGVAFLENVLMGSALTEDVIRTLDADGMGSIRRKIMAAIVPLVKNSSLKENALIDELGRAIEIHNEAKAAGLSITDYVAQFDMFKEKDIDVPTMAVAIMLDLPAFKKWVNEYNETVGKNEMFGGMRTKEGISDDVLKQKIKNYEQVRINLKNLAQRGEGKTKPDTGKENTGDEKRDREEGEADISRAAQAEARLKTAKSNYDKAAKQLNAAEEKISNKQTTQGSLLRSEGAQGQMFGLDRDEAKSILDPLRQKVRETKAELDAAQKEFIAATDQQLNLFDISNSSLQAGDTKTIGDYVTAAKAVLENLYPNAKLEVYNTTEEYEKAGGPKATRGFAIMGKEGKHRILLNLERISEDKSGKTAIHEVIHPIVYDAFGIDSDKLNEAWKDMSVVMKDVPGMEIVFAHVRNYAASKAAPEGITELLTQIVTGNINIENVPKEKKSKILEILNKILEFFGIDFRFGSAQDFAALAQKIKQSFDTSNPESLREIVKQKGIDKFIQEYERLSEKDISPQSRDEILNDFVKEQIAAGESLDDIKEALVDNGLTEDEAQKIIDLNTRPRIKVSVGGREGTKSDNKAIVNRMVNSNDISDEVKDILRANDLKYKVKSQKEARTIANAVINEFGIDDAVLLAEAGKFHGDVNSMIFALSLDKVYDIELSAKTPDEKQEAAERYADIAMRYQDVAESGGRFISAIYDFYKKSPAGLVIKAQKEFQRRQDEYFEGREKPTKEAWQEFVNTVEGKELLQEELGKISPKKKKIFTPDTEAKIKSFFSKLKINTKGQTGSYLIPPQIYNAAIDIIEGAVLTGVSIGKAIEQAVQYIGDNYKDTWQVKEFKKDIRDGFKKQNIQRTLSAEDREKILNKWSKKLIGLNQEQKNTLLNKAFLELVDNGALEYDQFKQIYAEALGLPQMTPELAAQLKDLAVKINEPNKLKDEILKTQSPELISKYKDAVKDAEIAATKLNDLIGKQKWWLNTFLTVMRLNTLGLVSLAGNIAYNVAALPVRFAVNLTATGIDYLLAGAQLTSDKVFGTSLYTKPPTHNVFRIQGGFLRGLWLGTTTSINQFFTGLSNRDYFQKEIKQNIKPLTSAKKFIRGMTGKQKLTLNEKLNSFIEAFPTMGMSAEVIARALNVGDKGFRFAAEFAKAEQIAQQKGLTGTAKEIFVLFPDEESEQKIREAGEKIVFQQKNVVTKALDSAGTAISNAVKNKGGEVKLLHGIAKTLGYTVQPFLNTPLNVFNEFIHYAFPPLPLYRAGKAMVQGDSEKSIYHLSQAIVGLSIGYAATQLVAQGLIIGAGDDDEDKERRGIQTYQRQGQINLSGLKRLLAGESPEPQDEDTWVDLKYYGFMGMLLLSKARQYDNKTKEQIESETYIQDIVGQFVPAVKTGLTEGVFSGTSTLMNAISMGGGYTDQWLLGIGNVFTNAFEPNWLRSLSMANNDYIRDTKGMTLDQSAKNQLKNRFFSGGDLPSKINIWGEKIESVPEGSNRYLYNIMGLNKKNILDNDKFGYALYDYYNQTKNYNIFPPVLEREVNKKPLTPEQYERFSILVGSHRRQLVDPLIQSGEFETLKANGVDGVVKKLGSIYGESRRLGVKEFEKLYPEFQIKKKKQEGQEDEIIEGEVEQ